MSHPLPQNRANMKNIVLEEQMELTLETQVQNTGRTRRKAQSRRAGWWFGQMRRVVDKAMDWSSNPAPRAHQVHFSLDRQSPNW